LLPRASFGKVRRWAAASARAGGAALGVAVVVSSSEPELVLGLLGLVLLVAGGATWTKSRRRALPFRIVLSLAMVVTTRLVLGPSGAALAALLLALGAWLRVRPADAVWALAVFGGAIAVLGDASLVLVLVFWILGFVIAVLRPFVVRMSVQLATRRFLSAERTKPVGLDPEN
jgi:hypothetical protein